MKIILDNIIYSKTKNGGISNYWFELSKYLLKKETDSIKFFEKKNSRENFHRKQLTIEDSSIINEPENIDLLSRILPVSINTDDYFLYHSSFYRSISTTKKHCEITTIHDFTHNLYSSFLKKTVHNKLKYSSIKKSNGIICISNSTYNDLMRYCPPNKNQKVAVIYNGVSDDYFKIDHPTETDLHFLSSNKIVGDYVLFIGSRANYKNFDFVINLLKETPHLMLVVVGEPFNQQELKKIGKYLLERIILVTNASNNQLNILYNFALAFIYPSSYEGFGIPIIESMKSGCPVLALNNSSIPEVSGDASILFDNLSIKNFQNALIDLKNSDFKCDLIERGFAQSKKFSWEKCCQETHAFYSENY